MRNFVRIEKGTTRYVIIFWIIAIKIPSLHSYINFLCGQLANINESKLYKLLRDERLCPVIFSLPFGLLVIMPKVILLSEEEFCYFNYESFCINKEATIPAECKYDSFGYYKGRIVAIDYGG